MLSCFIFMYKLCIKYENCQNCPSQPILLKTLYLSRKHICKTYPSKVLFWFVWKSGKKKNKLLFFDENDTKKNRLLFEWTAINKHEKYFEKCIHFQFMMVLSPFKDHIIRYIVILRFIFVDITTMLKRAYMENIYNYHHMQFLVFFFIEHFRFIPNFF